MTVDEQQPDGLNVLEKRIAQDFERLSYPPADWTPEETGQQGDPIADVLIVGAGMNGLCAAFALRRLGISRIRHIDARDAGLEGPWLTYARMEYLRSPKHLTGPALGMASLTFRAWWEAQYGSTGWDRLGYILREDWARYLGWYARVTGSQVENATRLTSLHPGQQYVTARIDGPSGVEDIMARQIVLATGREGQASPRIPAPFTAHMGVGVQHSSAPLDASDLAGRKIVVVGLSASAFDNACVAAEAGADVTLLGRAPHLPAVNKMKQTVYPGFAHGFPDLPDGERLAWLRMVTAARTAPPRHTVQRAARAGVKVVLGEETSSVIRDGDILKLTTEKNTYTADQVILGTGFRFDLGVDPALSDIASEILLWRDVAEATAQDDDYLECPALGPGFDLRPNHAATTPGLGRIRCFTHAAQPSLGNLSNDIPQASEGADRLARSLASSLFVDDTSVHRQRLKEYSDPELLGDEISISTS